MLVGTDIICIGNNTKKCCQTVTSEDHVAQRHEKLGTVGKHCHDNYASIIKYVREEQPETLNQLDTGTDLNV